MIQSITFDTENDRIIMRLQDATEHIYTRSEREQYLTDFPDRAADVEAMGWTSEINS